MIRHVLTDIEGTTSSISFVKEVLFPYAHRALPGFLEAHGEEADVVASIEEVRAELQAPQATVAEVTQTLQGWIDEDRKATPLKRLQGMIWKRGYEEGDYHAHLYGDTAPCLKRWKAAGYGLSVYSSGSVKAQELFFRYSVAGDLKGLFQAQFDTEVGGKKEQAS